MVMSRELESAIERLRGKKPSCIYVDSKSATTIGDTDALSVGDVTIFKNGGMINGDSAVPFVEGNDELMDVLKLIF